MSGQYDCAVQAFREAVSADAGYAAGHNNLGLILQLQGRLYEAATEFQRAGRLDRRALEPVMNLGRLYEAVGWDDDAIRQYEKAARQQSGNAEVQGRLAQMYVRSGRRNDALESLLRALAHQEVNDEWKSWALAQLSVQTGAQTKE